MRHTGECLTKLVNYIEDIENVDPAEEVGLENLTGVAISGAMALALMSTCRCYTNEPFQVEQIMEMRFLLLICGPVT